MKTSSKRRKQSKHDTPKSRKDDKYTTPKGKGGNNPSVKIPSSSQKVTVTPLYDDMCSSLKKEEKVEEIPLHIQVKSSDPSTNPIVVSFPSGIPYAMLHTEENYEKKCGRKKKIAFKEKIKELSSTDDDSSSAKSSSSSSSSSSDSEDNNGDEDANMEGFSDDSDSDKNKGETGDSDDDDGDDNSLSIDQDSIKDGAVPVFTSARISNSQLSSNEPSTPRASSSPTVDRSRKTDRILKGLDSTNKYTSYASGSLHDGRKTKFFVGIYHKPSGRLVLHESSERGTVHALTQSVTKYEGDVSLDTQQLSLTERRQLLFESFGSVKKQRALRSQRANVVEMKSVVGVGDSMMSSVKSSFANSSESNIKAMEKVKKMKEEEMDAEKISDGKNNKDMKNTTPGIKLNPAVDEAYNLARRKFLPPFNENADEPYKIYDAKRTVGEELWGWISRFMDFNIHNFPSTWKTEIFNTTSKDKKEGDELQEEDKGTSKFVPKMTLKEFEATKQILATLPDDITNRNSKTALKTIILLHYLLNFHKQVSSNKFLRGTPHELSRQWSMPLPIVEKFLSLFCCSSSMGNKSGYASTKQLLDKRLAYILILYMLPHGTKMKVGNVNQLCDDLKITTREASNYYRQSGCTCLKKSGGILSVSLKAPLTFPPPPRRNG